MDKLKRYATKAELGRCFSISQPTVAKRVKGIEQEMKRGRYNQYAVADGLISIAVFADYSKYHKRLNDKNLRRTVKPFCLREALEYLEVDGGDGGA